MKSAPSRRGAVLEALLVTFLWSTSFVLVKEGLSEIPPLTFAGLRYGLAALCLAPFALRGDSGRSLRRLTRRRWAELALLGLLLYAITQGAIFIGLQRLPAVTVNLLLNLTSPLVAALGIVLLGERPSVVQWAGILLFVVGAIVFFFPVRLEAGAAAAVAAVILGVAANAGAVVLGRSVNRDQSLGPLPVTAVSMAIGAAALLLAGAVVQGVPRLGLQAWAVIVWLAVVNTAIAFTLWNRTLRTLTAAESSVLNGTMLVQVALLAWLFLDEGLTLRQIAGMALAGVGAVTVQVRGRLPAEAAGRARPAAGAG
jgi:drug/metabolite transporter (DMT)-like permease